MTDTQLYTTTKNTDTHTDTYYKEYVESTKKSEF